MRLNLGCGKHYKEGFINIDAFDATVADTLMSVGDLAFQSNSVDAIEACQLIEHLGYLHAISALAEWFRVLKPGGTLLIETPDLDSSMKQYVHGNHDAKKEILTWIYGVESPGMEHRLCFPKVLLKNLLKKSGFTEITASCFTIEKYHPVLRISSKKTQDYTVFGIISQSRKELVKQRLVDFNNNPLALEQEKLLDFFREKLQEYLKKNDEKILEQIMISGCIQNVPMTQVLFQECRYQKIMPKHIVKQYVETLQFLVSVHFTDLLHSIIKEIPPVAGTQKKTMTVVTTFGKQSIREIMSNSKGTEVVKKALVSLSKKYPCDEHMFFSEALLKYEAADLCYRAIKDFIAKDFTNASAKLQEAIRLDRNHLLYYWNLGRALMLTKKISEATRCYRDALTLVSLAPVQQKKKLGTTLQKERNHFSPAKHSSPVLDVRL
jgi:predicted SAM-dependent methyltransferase